MKATTKLFMMLLVVASMLTFASCRKLPAKITVSGQVTYEDGQPAEGAGVRLTKSTFMSPIYPVESTSTDENGHYEMEFTPNEKVLFTIEFSITKDGYVYSHSEFVDEYKANQEINAVLKKDNE